MASGQRRSALSYIPGFKNNAVLQLILFCATAYIMLAIAWAITMIIYSGHDDTFQQTFIHNIALSEPSFFKSHWWTIFTYGWFQVPNSFMELLSSMLWLYCFGSVVQMLVGHRQIVPLFIYCLIIGGIGYEVGQLLPGRAGDMHHAFFLGSRAGLMGMCIAAITLAPDYRFYLTETFTIPLLVVVGIFSVLMFIGSGFNLPILIMLAIAGLSGFGYVKLLRSGYRPGEWMYDIIHRIESTVTPSGKHAKPGGIHTRVGARPVSATAKSGISQTRIDEILDKINLKGYNSLTREEKDLLQRAGKD